MTTEERLKQVEDRLREDLTSYKSDIGRVRQEIEALDAEIASLRSKENALKEKIVYNQTVLQMAEPLPNPNQRPLIEVGKAPPERKLTMIQMAVDILTAEGRRLRVAEIVDRAIMEKMRDAPTPEAKKKFLANMSSILSHHSRSENPLIVKSTKKRGYYKLAPVATTISGVNTAG